MNQNEAIAILAASKGLLARLEATKGHAELSEGDLNLLQKVYSVWDAGFADDDNVMVRANLRMGELALLLGTYDLRCRRARARK